MLKRISKNQEIGKNVRIGANAHLAENISIGDNVTIDRNATILEGVVIGKESFIGCGVILGERTRNFYQNPKNYKPETCSIGKNAIIRAHTIIYSGAVIGNGFECGSNVLIREHTKIGANSRVGTGSDIQGYCKIGNYVSAHSNVTVGQNSEIEDFVWLHPYALLLNDLYPPTALDMKGPRIGRYSVIGVKSLIFPKVVLGEHVIVAAASVVKNNVKDYQIVSGNPARKVVDARGLKALVGKRVIQPYPWMKHREKGYPWEKHGWQSGVSY